jgi:hypothetical protein
MNADRPNIIISCGSKYDPWVRYVLKYLPSNILREFGDKLAFFSTAEKDACRVARAICEQHEIILLSERILPAGGDDSKERYFVFAVLHEIAHAVKQHLSPLLDRLTQEEIAAQEKEADDLALSWFNDYVEDNKHLNIERLTLEEIEKAKRENQELMKKE